MKSVLLLSLSICNISLFPSSKILTSLQNNTFKISDWEMIFMSIDFERYADSNYSLTFSDEEKTILQIVEVITWLLTDINLPLFLQQFDEAMKKAHPEQEGSKK